MSEKCDHEDHNLVSDLRNLLKEYKGGKCDHEDHDLVSSLKDLLAPGEFQPDIFGMVDSLKIDIGEIRSILDTPAEMDTVERVESYIEQHQTLEESVGDLLYVSGDSNLDTINELLDDTAEMVKILDPILGGFSRDDDMDTITLRVLVHRISRKLLGR